MTGGRRARARRIVLGFAVVLAGCSGPDLPAPVLTLAPAAFEVEGRAERSGQELCLGGGARARAPLYVSRRGVRFTVFFRSSQEARSFAVRWDGRILGHGDPGGQDGSQWTFQVRAGRGTHVLDLEPRGQGRLLCLEKVAVTQF